MTLADDLKELEQALDEVTQEMREADGEPTNPILVAESAPNRFSTMSLFFDDIRGVRIERDNDLDSLAVYLFDDSGEIELDEESLLADWSREFFLDNY